MMIVMKPTATAEEVEAVVGRVHGVGARAHVIHGEELYLDRVCAAAALAGKALSEEPVAGVR